MTSKPLDPTITKQVMEEFLRLKRMRFVNMGDPETVYIYCLHENLPALGTIALEAMKRPSEISKSLYIEILRRQRAYMNKYGLKD